MKRVIAIVVITIIGLFAASCDGNSADRANGTSTNKNAANGSNSANSNAAAGREGEHGMMNGDGQRMGDRRRNEGMRMRPEANGEANRGANRE
jgi:hypothetical protein